MALRTLSLIGGLMVILLAGSYAFLRHNQTAAPPLTSSPPANSTSLMPQLPTTAPAIATVTPSPDNTATPNTLPDHVLLAVPFLAQAPLANWDTLHEEACEEASLIMVQHVLDKSPIASKEAGDKEILDLINYETSHGYDPDITVGQLATVAHDFYGLTGHAKTSITIDAIKYELALGHPVIVPAAGRLLHNPNFRQPDPNYHMLVVKGYDSQGFITNDPGTRNGEGYRYSFETLFSAIHDWNTDDITKGEKAYLVFE